MVSFEDVTARGELRGNDTYRAALAAEEEGRLREAHRLFRSVRDADGGASVRAQVESDIMRVIVEMFGVKGSDQRMSVWSVFQYFNVRDRRPRCIH